MGWGGGGRRRCVCVGGGLTGLAHRLLELLERGLEQVPPLGDALLPRHLVAPAHATLPTKKSFLVSFLTSWMS